MITIPERYTYAEMYLTLRCNFSCHWCINRHTGVKRLRPELTGREWVAGLKNIKSHIPITLGGGEPTLHPDFYRIVNDLSSVHTFDLLSNGSFDVNEFLEKTTPSMFTIREPEYKSIRLSYHAGYTDPSQIVNTARTLQDNGYSVGIFGLNHPHNLSKNIAMTQKALSSGIFFFIRDFLGYFEDKLYGYYMYPGALNGNRKKCKCRIQEMLVGPDGNVYRCHRDLYEPAGEIGNILNVAFDITDEFRPCSNLGLCNPCDIKKKSNPDLTTPKCSVEIEGE